MATRFRPSAARHGISVERVRFAIAACPLPLFDPKPEHGPDLVLFLGPDANGVLLEIVAIELDGGDLVVIHAMRLRKAYLAAYAEVMLWR